MVLFAALVLLARAFGLAQGYIRLQRACVSGHNIALHKGKTLGECKEICSSDPACKAFEYGVSYGGSGDYEPGDCQPQSAACSRDCNGADHNLDLYIKRAREMEGTCASVMDAMGTYSPGGECSGNSYWPSGQYDEFDCDTEGADSACARLGFEANAYLCGNSNCPWGDGDDCCQRAKNPPFRYNGYLGPAFAAEAEQEHCENHQVCSSVCQALEASRLGQLCEVRSKDGLQVFCALDSVELRAALPVVDLAAATATALDTDLTFEFILSLSFSVKLCGAPSVSLAAQAQVSHYAWDGTAPVCEGNCDNFGQGSFLGLNDEDHEHGNDGWGWTGKIDDSGDGATCTTGNKALCGKMGTALEKAVELTAEEVEIFNCNDMLKDMCSKLKNKFVRATARRNPFAGAVLHLTAPGGFSIRLKAVAETEGKTATVRALLRVCSTDSPIGKYCLDDLLPDTDTAGMVEVFKLNVPFDVDSTACDTGAPSCMQHCSFDRPASGGWRPAPVVPAVLAAAVGSLPLLHK